MEHHHHDSQHHAGAPPLLVRRRAVTRNVLLIATVLIASLLLLQQQQSSCIPQLQPLVTKKTDASSYSLNQQQQHQQQEYVYIPSHAEQFLVENPSVFGFNTTGHQTSSGCRLWRAEQSSNTNISLSLLQELQDFQRGLKTHADAVEAFAPIGDLRLHLNDPSTPTTAASSSATTTSTPHTNNHHDFCQMVNLHADGIPGFFTNNPTTTSNNSHLLSYSNAAGYMEPLLPPMRHPLICQQTEEYLMDLTYMIHDFGALCRKLKRHSRIVLFDMGASLTFHTDGTVPIVHLINLYTKFGFPFDHIYAYEMTPTDPNMVFGKSLPVELMPAYHWINVGVVSEPGHRLNPFTTLLEKYNEDDIVIVKLDIDTPHIEVPLAKQILADPKLAKLIDHFYFEHHVHLAELGPYWGSSMQGSVQDSLQLFYSLRQAGVAAHFWP